jgi:Tfp pilus assembly protein PilO
MNGTASSTKRERLQQPLTWHVIGTVVLALAVAAMAVRLGMDWQAMRSSSAEALQSKRMELKTLTLRTEPLRGLDKRVAKTRTEMDAFYDQRIPTSYSSIAAEIGALEVKSGVRLSRVSYAQKPGGDKLTEIALDAGVSGEYPQIMKFVNGLERDPMFFVIRAMSLTGQQAGMVNLRLRVSTWMRPADAAASQTPEQTASGAAASPAEAGKTSGGEGE